MEIQERPAHYKGPNLDPSGVKLYPRFLGTGVYALMASRVPRDNSGVVIGSRGALVIDAGINDEMARQIQDRVKKLTDKPILYLVNTNYHGDHTFGNAAFPNSVEIVAHLKTREGMNDLAAEKKIRSRRVALILVDYPRQLRLKILGRVEIFEGEKAKDWLARVRDPDYKAVTERVYVNRIEAFDWNYQQHIIPRFTVGEIRTVLQPIEKQMQKLHQENEELRQKLIRCKSE